MKDDKEPKKKNPCEYCLYYKNKVKTLQFQLEENKGFHDEFKLKLISCIVKGEIY